MHSWADTANTPILILWCPAMLYATPLAPESLCEASGVAESIAGHYKIKIGVLAVSAQECITHSTSHKSCAFRELVDADPVSYTHLRAHETDS